MLHLQHATVRSIIFAVHIMDSFMAVHCMFRAHIEPARQLLHKHCTTSPATEGNAGDSFCTKNSPGKLSNCSPWTSLGSTDKFKGLVVSTFLRQGYRSMLLECLQGFNRVPCNSVYFLDYWIDGHWNSVAALILPLSWWTGSGAFEMPLQHCIMFVSQAAECLMNKILTNVFYVTGIGACKKIHALTYKVVILKQMMFLAFLTVLHNYWYLCRFLSGFPNKWPAGYVFACKLHVAALVQQSF